MTDRWIWDKPDPSRSGVAGDVAKLFKAESVKQPGVLEQDAPSRLATFLAREAIQNSWDAAEDLRSDLRKSHVRAGRKGLPEPPPFEVRFLFHEAQGRDKERLVFYLGLDELGNRLDSGVSRQEVGLGESDHLNQLRNTNTGLTYLVIEEQASSGMYGPWRSDDSKMYQALLTLGVTTGEQGKGGSFGYGKAGMIRGSAIKTLVAYTCFRERSNDPGVTRRLLGVTYWGRHKYRGSTYTGWARLGKPDYEGVRPLENEEADDLAKKLGLQVRSPNETAELGTTFLLVEPTMQPDDLLKAVERSWWPALEEHGLQFSVSICTPSGENLFPQPRQDAVLETFINAYEVALSGGGVQAINRCLARVLDNSGWCQMWKVGHMPISQATKRIGRLATGV
ncbi:MAG: hypothetical protein OXH10_09440 [bacterium]|nr:hypothetical protein [bacterium]